MISAPRADKRFGFYCQPIMKGSIYSDKHIVSYRTGTRNNHMRGNKAVVTNCGVVPHMIAAPQNSIIANFSIRLNGVIFKYKTIFSKLRLQSKMLTLGMKKVGR